MGLLLLAAVRSAQEEEAMKRIIRQGAVVGLALAIAGVPASIAFAEESTPTVNGAQAETVPFSDPCTDIEPGAASMEPQEVESEIHDQAQSDWVASIWVSP
jgi:hypothetical protein